MSSASIANTETAGPPIVDDSTGLDVLGRAGNLVVRLAQSPKDVEAMDVVATIEAISKINKIFFISPRVKFSYPLLTRFLLSFC